MKKVLWIVDGDRDRFIKQALAIGAKAVCVRTTNTWLGDSISDIKKAGLDVYGWRWPAVLKDTNASHHYAMDEARFVVDLIGKGLDGYIVDPEGDTGRSVDYWNDRKYTKLAADMSDMIVTAGKKANDGFLFGLTSGCTYPTGFPDIPWHEFVKRSDCLFPQVYWVGDSGIEHGGTPEAAYSRGLKSWKSIAGNTPIVPIIGQIAKVSAADIRSYKTLVDNPKLSEIHFYSYTLTVPPANWDAMKAL